MRRVYLALIASVLLLSMTACANTPPAAKYPAAYIVSEQQAETLNSLARINPEGTFYMLDYTADYRLDDLLNDDVTSLTALIGWVQSNLLQMDQTDGKANMGGGCSAFVGVNGDGELLYGRNYDYVQNAQNILVHCDPENGYESVSMAAGGWLFETDKEGNFIQLDDGKTDLSMLVAAPYLLMDGMNEKGVIMCVLTLDGDGTVQKDPAKHGIQTTAGLRLVLDKAASVPEAITLLQQYNMNASMLTRNFHFLVADAEGHYAIIEYSPEGEMRYSMDDAGNYLNLLTGSEAPYDQRLVTNFYRLFPSETYGFDDGQHGLDRFEQLLADITEAKDHFSEDEAMDALSRVYQDFGETATHETQWSVVYNPADLTAKVCPRVNQTDKKDTFYAVEYDFDFSKEFSDAGDISYVSKPTAVGK